MDPNDKPPILENKHYDAPSVFLPESMLRESRRQLGRSQEAVPEVCVLDPDGDIVRQARADGRAQRHPGWACYHSDLWVVEGAGFVFGVVACAVGASFAVVVAEQLFVSGCRVLISLTSAGQITPVHEPPYFVLIDRALRDEGTSYHYLPPGRWSNAPDSVLRRLEGAYEDAPIPVVWGSSWTTDAPYRETAAAVAEMERQGVLAVEMEAAALYALAQKRDYRIVCLAQVTNQMGQQAGDFEKGEAGGTQDALAVLAAAARALR